MQQNPDFLDDLDIKINSAQLKTLGSEWNTDNFQASSIIIPYVRLYLPVEGEGLAVHHGKKYLLQPGNLYLISSFTPVQLKCEKKLVKYWVHFNAHVFKSKIDLFSVFDTEYEIPLKSYGLYKKLFERLCEIHKHRTPVTAFEAKCILGKILVPFLEKMDGKQSPSLLIIYEVMNYIERNIERPLTLKMLANKVNLNPTYLSNMFAARMGIPLIRYCIQRRISHAIGLFKNNTLRLEEIAQKSGFEKAETFTKLFKRHTGFTPSSYRKKILAGNETVSS